LCGQSGFKQKAIGRAFRYIRPLSNYFSALLEGSIQLLSAIFEHPCDPALVLRRYSRGFLRGHNS
jgi:hypothetical protein